MQKKVLNVGQAVGLALALAAVAAGGATLQLPAGPGSTAPEASASPYGRLPLMFEPVGGPGAAPAYCARGGGYLMTVLPGGFSLTLGSPANHSRRGVWESSPVAARTVRISFSGSSSAASVTGEEALPTRVSYLKGSDSSHWSLDRSTFARVRAQEVYPGVDVVYYGNHRQVEYDLVVAPKTGLHEVSLDVSGADRLELAKDGTLALHLGDRRIIQGQPVAYQMIDGHRRNVSAQYQLAGRQSVRIQVGKYDERYELIIDPILVYSTYLGGTGQEDAWSIAVDSAGNAYVAGATLSVDLAVTNAYQTNFAGDVTFGAGGDAYVAKLGPQGTNYVFLTYFGGSAMDVAYGIKVDSTGNIYLGGFTASTNFPVTANAFQHAISGTATNEYIKLVPFDGFITKFDPTGTNLLYSTYFGGSNVDEIVAIDVDSAGNIYAAGTTLSPNLPVTAGAFQTTMPGLTNAFIAKFNPSLAGAASLVYSTFFGGTNDDEAEAIAIDTAGNAFITGESLSTNFPVVNAPVTLVASNALYAATPGNYHAFLTKLSPAGSAALFSTFLANDSSDYGAGVALDGSGNPFVTGRTYPATSLGGPLLGLAEEFVVGLSANGSTVLARAEFGGQDADTIPWAIAVDPSGAVYVAGQTASPSFTNLHSWITASAGAPDAFLQRVVRSGTTFNPTFATIFGGSLTDVAHALALDPSNNVYLAGTTADGDFLANTNVLSTNAVQTVFEGVTDSFVSKIQIEPPLTFTTVGSNFVFSWVSAVSGLVLQSAPALTGPWTTLSPQPTPTVTGFQYTATVPIPGTPTFYRLILP